MLIASFHPSLCLHSYTNTSGFWVKQGRTIWACVHNLASQQDHHAVEESEARGRWRVNGCADRHPRLQQHLYHYHHLQTINDVDDCQSSTSP